MDRYDDVTERIQKSMRRDWLVKIIAPLALAVGLGALALGYARLGRAVTATTKCPTPAAPTQLARAGCAIALPNI